MNKVNQQLVIWLLSPYSTTKGAYQCWQWLKPFCLQGVNNVTLVRKWDKVLCEMRALTDFDRWMIFGSRRSASEMKYRNMQNAWDINAEMGTCIWHWGCCQYHCGVFLKCVNSREKRELHLFIYIQAFIAFFHMVWCVIYQGYNQQRNGGESGQKEMVAGIAPGLQILYLSTPLSL